MNERTKTHEECHVMTEYVSSALFIYTEDTAHFSEPLQNNSFDARITPVAFDELIQNSDALLNDAGHIVVSGNLNVIRTVFKLAMKYDLGVGIIPTDNQKNLIRFYDLPTNIEGAIDLALQEDAQEMDVVLSNGTIVLFKAVIGRLPLLDIPSYESRLKFLATALQRLLKLKLIKFEFTPAGKETIETAASGCMIFKRSRSASRVVAHHGSITDKMLSMVVSAPISIVDYLKFLTRLIVPSAKAKQLPRAVGYIRSPRINIQSENNLDVFIDGERVTQTPLQFETAAETVRINVGAMPRQEIKSDQPAKETLDIENLPRGKELLKALKKKKVPFFSYASEERFRDLFMALRLDARTDMNYLVLMVLSTLLATTGLYLNSASVVIGAMLLAPLMAPIVSLAMGLLRSDEGLLKNSLVTIVVGTVLGLLASSLMTLLFPHKPITDEMLARLNPTLLDLGVAIFSGIAAAYSKSFKEIIQSLAGVAIAVALVPPLSVAGIGIGRGDLHFFSQAFLLFATNLVGIILAATFTFRMLGFSPAVRSKRNLVIVLLLLTLITIPLYLAYDRIVEKRVLEKTWQQERFLVNGKYIIVHSADISRRGDKEVAVMEIMTRDLLTRDDLAALKKKIQANISRKLKIRIKTIYIP